MKVNIKLYLDVDNLFRDFIQRVDHVVIQLKSRPVVDL